jgi:hypothetical protein
MNANATLGAKKGFTQTDFNEKGNAIETRATEYGVDGTTVRSYTVTDLRTAVYEGDGEIDSGYITSTVYAEKGGSLRSISRTFFQNRVAYLSADADPDGNVERLSRFYNNLDGQVLKIDTYLVEATAVLKTKISDYWNIGTDEPAISGVVIESTRFFSDDAERLLYVAAYEEGLTSSLTTFVFRSDDAADNLYTVMDYSDVNDFEGKTKINSLADLLALLAASPLGALQTRNFMDSLGEAKLQ